MLNEQEIWQIEVQGQIYEADLEELIQWISEGSVLPLDKVKRGNLRWIEAEKVPLLYGFFNAHEFDIDVQSFISTTNQDDSDETAQRLANLQNFFQNETKISTDDSNLSTEKPFSNTNLNETTTVETESGIPNACFIHPDREPRYVCKTCLTLYCKNCPKSYGGDVKICPGCGAMCMIYEGNIEKLKSVGAINKPYVRTEEELLLVKKNAGQIKFGSADLTKSLIYPFRFKVSLIIGAIMFVIFTLGQTVWVFGGALLVSAIFCAMLANTLTFGILANTLENFSQNKTDADFMPRFDDFSAWDDVIHPFLLSIGVYVVSFGLLIALAVGATWNTVNSLNEIDEGKEKIVSTVLPVSLNDSALAKQSAQVNQLTGQNKKTSTSKDANSASDDVIAGVQNTYTDQQTELQKLQNQIKQSQQIQIKAIIQDNPNGEENYLSELPDNVMRLSLIFSIPFFLAFLWGIFYFPAACAVAGYTRSFTAILNPLIGFDTIKRLGSDYGKILFMFLNLGIFWFVVSGILGKLFAPLNLPQVGNLAAKTVSAFLAFYLWTVFSVLLGNLLDKNSERLKFTP